MARHIGLLLFALITFVVLIIGALTRASEFDWQTAGMLLLCGSVFLLFTIIKVAQANLEADSKEWENRQHTPTRPGKVYQGQDTSPSTPERNRSMF